MSAPPIPAPPADLTPEWLTHLLRAGGLIDAARVADADAVGDLEVDGLIGGRA